MGHRRIGFIHGDGEFPVTPKRLLGFRTACAESGLRVPDEYVRAARYHDPDTCARQALAMMKQRVPPTALLFPDDYSALGGVEALRSLGLRIPEDVSVVGYDGLPLCRAFYPRLTTYWQDGAGLGATAATLLIEHIETTDQGAPVSRSVMISGHLQRGGSVMPPKR
jgi:LacI family transcriptional regulator